MEEELQELEQERKYWHSGYIGGFELAFRKYKWQLSYEEEHTLSKQPLKIDFLVIKKENNLVINNAIGAQFRKYNIIEIKNPDDDLNEDVVWKTIGYAGIYKSLVERVGEIPANELTITISRTRKPVKLIGKLLAEGKEIDNPFPGIYYLKGIIEIPIQIVVIKELQGKEFNALKILTENAANDDVLGFIDDVKTYVEQGDIENANAVFNLFKQVNSKMFYEMRGENDMKFDSLADLFEDDLIAREKKGEARGEIKGKAEGKAEERENGIEIFIKDKIEDDIPNEVIIAKLQKNYKLSAEDAKEYVKKYTPVAEK